jgi:class 3 adenylate cyclase
MFRVAVNSGPALVGNIGSPELRNFSALGDTTNVAARLQTFAPEGAVVVGQRTYELIREVADVRPLGTAELKGKSSPTAVFQLLGIRTQAA